MLLISSYITPQFIMYKYVLCSVKSPRVQRLAFDRVARLFRTRGVRAITTGACAQRAFRRGHCVSPARMRLGLTRRSKRERKRDWDRVNGEKGRERENNRKVVKREMLRVPGWGWESERAGSTEKARPGSFKPALTTRDFAVYVLCRVDTRRDILTRQTAAVARRVGISPGWYVYDRQRRTQLGRGMLATIPPNPSILQKQSLLLFVSLFFFIIPQCLSTIKVSCYDCFCTTWSNLTLCRNVSPTDILLKHN